MSITIVQPSWKVCPEHLRQQDQRKNAFRRLTPDDNIKGVENRERILNVLRDNFKGSGLNILVHGSQVYNPQQGEDFDLIALYDSRDSLRPLEHFCNVENAPIPVASVLRAILGRQSNSVLDFLECELSSFRFKFQIHDSDISLNVFFQPIFERVAKKGFHEDYNKIRIMHPNGPFMFKRAALFDKTSLWIPSKTSTIRFDGQDYWLRGYYGWLLEPHLKAFSGLPKTVIGHLVTSEAVLQENEGIALLFETAEKAFATALEAYSIERKRIVDPCNAFIRVERFTPEFTERLRMRILRHTSDEHQTQYDMHQPSILANVSSSQSNIRWLESETAPS
ncbi:MAG: hypothetical protein ABIJ34_02270 [archaeon]